MFQNLLLFNLNPEYKARLFCLIVVGNAWLPLVVKKFTAVIHSVE